MVPFHTLVDDLPLPLTVEEQRRGVAVLREGGEHGSRHLARQEMAHQRFPGAGFDDGAVAQNQGEGARELLEDGAGKVVAPPRRKHDFNSGIDRPLQRLEVLPRHVSGAVE